MTLITCSVLLLVILGETYCKTTATANKSSTSWSYDYSLNDTSEFEVKHDDNGIQLEPLDNNASTVIKKYYNSNSIHSRFTSPGTNINGPHATGDVINGASNVYTDSRPKGAIPNIVKTQTYASIIPNPSQEVVLGNRNGYPNLSANGPVYQTAFRVPYSSLNTPMYGAPSGSLFYPQTIPYGQMYGPTGGPMYGIPNGQMYNSPSLPPMGPIYGYGPQNGQMYGQQNGQAYDYSTGSSYGSYRNY